MIIESKFHDYYDCLAKQFRDKTLVFKRHQEDAVDKLPCEVVSYNPHDKFYTHLYYIIFCGKLFPYLEKYLVGTGGQGGQYSFSFDIEEIRKEIGSTYKTWNTKTQDKLNKSLNFDWTEFCIKHNTPIILIRPDHCHRHRNLELNPILKNIEFYKVKDTNQAYQEIVQFIGMVLTKPEKSPRPIDDKLKAKNHGFDKWSFRKDTPPNRKQK